MAKGQTLDTTHAVELAVKAHLDYTARLVCVGKNRSIYEVPSINRSTTHDVVYVHQTGELLCDCTAAQHGNATCAHVGAVIVHRICERKARAA